MNLQGCTALITGASAGLGANFARQLAGRAASLVLVARRRERLEELRDELTKIDPNLNVQIWPADLSKAEEVEALCVWLEQEMISIDFLINNAGLGDHGPFLTSELTRVDEMMQVNIVALTLLTRRLLPSLLAAQRGAILNVSSSASFMPIARMAVYAASKAYVTSFSEALRMELHGTNVSVSALCPGPVETEFSSVAARPNERKETAPKFIYVSPQEVVRSGLHAIEHGHPVVVPGWPMKIAMGLVRLTPMPILRLASRFGR